MKKFGDLIMILDLHRQSAFKRDPLEGARAGRTCLRMPAQQHGRQVRPRRREDRDAEPGLQHAPPGGAGTQRGGGTLMPRMGDLAGR